MAITYHAGRRLQGLAPLSADTTNTQVTASNGVVSFDITTRTTNQAVTYDIGSNLSDSAWVMRSKLDYVAITGGSGSTAYLELGVGSASSSTAFANGGITQDFIGLQQRKASDADGWGLVGYNSTGGLDNPESPLMDAVPNTSTTYYVEIKRLTSTSMSIGLYTTSSYGTLISGIALETKTISSGVTGLRYIRVGNAGMISETAGNVIEGTVTDIEIWDGVTTASGDSTYQVHDPKPTNVQVGSRYEETDTRKMYHYNDPLILDEDFDYATQVLADAKWVTNSTVARVNVSTDKLGFAWTSGATDQGCYYDLGSVSDTKWLLKFVINYTSETASGYHPIHNFFVSSSNSSLVYPVSSAGIGYQYAVGGTDLYFKSTISSGGEVAPSAVSWNASANTDYYVEIKRTSATTAEMRVRTGSHSGTVVSTQLMTGINSACIGLRYLRLQQYLTGSFGAVSGTIDDVEFYNGVTSAGNVWKEEGT